MCVLNHYRKIYVLKGGADMDKSEKEKTVIIKNIVVAVLVITFLVGVVLVFYNMVYAEKRDNIIKDGQMAAMQSAEKFQEYLSTSIDAIELSAYTIDGMLEKNTNEEILDYLVGQTTAITSTVFENTSGLYGYINGEFLDGLLWVPDDDFVATERPWYKKAIENKGKITMVEPYLDAQTGGVLMAISKMLSDGKSVVSMDITLDVIQQITEGAVNEDSADIEFIIDNRGMVIAHSDKQEVGKNYNEESGTVGAAVIALINQSDNNYYEFYDQNSHYIAYSAPIQNDWHCVFIKNATAVFRPLRTVLIVVIVAILAIIVSISVIMIRSGMGQLTAERLSSQLSSTADIYVSMHEINFVTDTFIEVRSNKEELSTMIGGVRNNCQQMIRSIMSKFSDDTTRESILDFVDFNKMNDRLKDCSTVTSEFLSAEGKWRRARYIVSDRTADGRVARAMFLVEDIEAERRERDKAYGAAQKLGFQIRSIANIYIGMFDINLKTNTLRIIKSDNEIVNNLIGDQTDEARKRIKMVMERLSDPSYLDEVKRFVNFSTLTERLKNTDVITLEFLTITGKWVRLRFIISQRNDSGKPAVVLLLVEDIDNEKKERDELIDASERAIAASEAKSSFLSSMSHEIRTPINAVLGMNEMILRECSDQNILSYSDSIRTAGNTLLGLINDILDFSKIEAGKMEIIPVDYDLSSVINDLVNMIQTRADDKGLKLELDISRNVPKLLHGDEVRIKQVITNLLTNAVKYTEKGIVTFCIRYEALPGEPDSILLKVYVKDTGIGIRKEDMDKLFSEFNRIEEERNRNVEGTGLGMSITKRLLEMMGSTLEVESVYELGSKFSFQLKQTVVKWEELGDYEISYKAFLGKRARYREKFRAPDAQVLVVDDTEMNLTVFRSLLKQTGVKIDTAASGDEGLALAYDKKYDIIFLDHMMPEKDGIETLHELRSRPKDPNLDTPVICLTANAISGAREKYLAEGFDDYLTKPIDSAKLEEMMAGYLPEEKIQRMEDEPVTDNGSERPAEMAAGDRQGLPGFLMEIDELDVGAGIANCGSVEDYITVLKTYADMIEEHAAQIETYWQAGDLRNAMVKIHAMKSTSRIIGAAAIGDLAQELEQAGKDGNAEKVADHIDELLARCRGLGGQLAPLIDPPEEGEDEHPLISEEELREAYALMREAYDAFQIENIDELAASLRDYRIPDAEKARVKDILDAVSSFEYDRLPDILS